MNKSVLYSTIAAFAVVVALSSSPAHAGNKQLKHANGSKIHIKCTGSGCNTRMISADGNKGDWTPAGAGGRQNFNKLVSKWNGKGYN